MPLKLSVYRWINVLISKNGVAIIAEIFDKHPRLWLCAVDRASEAIPKVLLTRGVQSLQGGMGKLARQAFQHPRNALVRDYDMRGVI